MRVLPTVISTIVAAALIGASLLLPVDAQPITVAIAASITAVVFGIGAPRIVPTPTATATGVLTALAGLVAIWTATLVGGGYEFSTAAGLSGRPDLWLAPIASVVAVGAIAVFVIQLLHGPAGHDRILAVISGVVGVTVVTLATSWVLLQRSTDYLIAHWVSSGTGTLTALYAIVLAALCVSALAALIPASANIVLIWQCALGAVTAGILTAISSHPLRFAALIAAFIGILVHVMLTRIARISSSPALDNELENIVDDAVQLDHSASDSSPEIVEANPPADVNNIGVAARVALGIAPVFAAGLGLYFCVWLIPGIAF